MISVIVPVYNVEKYLLKCLYSIINQSYKDIEVLLIDDGSTDNSSSICDSFKSVDSRVRVFHTVNRGLSAARNLGLEQAKGSYIGFVDSDDWIEHEMYDILFQKALETNADIVECGVWSEFKNTTIERSANTRTVSGINAVEALIKGEIKTQVWNKIWKKTLFTGIRFPEGHVFEDIATTYKIVEKSTVTGVTHTLYHYTQRGDSISQNHTSKCLFDYWLAHKERYDFLKDKVDTQTELELLKHCAKAIAKIWVWYKRDGELPETIFEMSSYARNNFPIFGYSGWPFSLRIGVFLARSKSKVSFFTAHVLYTIYRAIRPKSFY